MVRRFTRDARSPGYNYHVDRCPDPGFVSCLSWGDFCRLQYPGPGGRLLCLEPVEEAVGRPACITVVRVEFLDRGVLHHRHQQEPSVLDQGGEEDPVEVLPVLQKVHRAGAHVQGRGLLR